MYIWIYICLFFLCVRFSHLFTKIILHDVTLELPASLKSLIKTFTVFNFRLIFRRLVIAVCSRFSRLFISFFSSHCFLLILCLEVQKKGGKKGEKEEKDILSFLLKRCKSNERKDIVLAFL